MTKQAITGIGGVFIIAQNPEKLGIWYQDHLGIPLPPSSYDEGEWVQPAGPTVIAFMAPDSEHFAGSSKTFALNFRVTDLAAIIQQLESAGISVERDPATYPNGIFASLKDPEGNLVQLWEPRG